MTLITFICVPLRWQSIDSFKHAQTFTQACPHNGTIRQPSCITQYISHDCWMSAMSTMTPYFHFISSIYLLRPGLQTVCLELYLFWMQSVGGILTSECCKFLIVKLTVRFCFQSVTYALPKDCCTFFMQQIGDCLLCLLYVFQFVGGYCGLLVWSRNRPLFSSNTLWLFQID